MATQSAVMRFFAGLMRGLDFLRRFLHLVLLLLFFSALIVLVVPETVVVPQSAALVLAPSGTIVDQLSGDALDRALAELEGNAQRETLLKDLVDAVRLAKDDERIQALYLQLDGLGATGLSKLQELAAAIDSFKESGKRVIAFGDNYSRDQFYLASLADEVYVHPMGMVLIEGYGRFMPYFKTALESLYVDYHVWTAGEYKSFAEPITRDDMSPEDREASGLYLGVLWSEYQSDVTRRRGLPADALQNIADNYADLLSASGGDTAMMAVDNGLVDGLLSRDEVNDLMLDVVGPDDDSPDRFSAIGSDRYLSSMGDKRARGSGRDRIAVLTLSGTIYDGSQAPGSIGGDSAARMIRDVTNDEDARALVLRVDSPGGSAFASEVILDEIEAFQRTGRPVVVSMSSVAASGGYWLSMSADQIWASATTITGSIGVGAVLPTFPRTLDKLGVHVDGLGTTDLAGQFTPTRPLGDEVAALYGQTVTNLYSRFIGQVAEHRGRTTEQIDAVARGRVWSGQHAYEYGLVDQLGGLDDAIESAASLAGLEPGAYRIDYVEQELGFAESLALEFAGVTAPVLKLLRIDAPWARHVEALLQLTLDPLQFLERQNDPRGLYAYCFCDVR